jgi:hypothetical protein
MALLQIVWMIFRPRKPPASSSRARSRPQALSVTLAGETIRQLVRELSSLLEEVRLEVSRGDPHPEVALAVFSFAEVADE